MNKKAIKSFVIALVLLLSVGFLSIKFWADGAAIAIEGPSFLRVTPDSELAILFQHSIIISNSIGSSSQLINLESLGINNHGDFDFFSNGDLLIYHSNHKTNLLDNISRFLRLKIRNELKPIGADGLYRCDKNAQNCQIFSSELPAFDSAFRVFIDRNDDSVFIADTPRFKIYKLDNNGNLLAQKNTGLKFPNQLYLKDKALYIANTNHHEITVVKSSTENFGELISHHPVHINNNHRWPSQLTSTGDTWWVNIMANGMNDGRIRIYDSQWKEISKVELPQYADPIGLIYFKEKIYIADWSLHAIYLFSIDGGPLGYFENADLQKISDQAFMSINSYKDMSLISFIIFILTVVLGSFAAFILEKEQTLKVLSGQKHFPKFDAALEDLEEPPGHDIYWIENRHLKNKLLINSSVAILFLILFSGYTMILLKEQVFPWQFHFIILSMLFLVFYVFQQSNKVFNIKIGVQGKYLLIDSGERKIISSQYYPLRYNPTLLVIGDTIAVLGNPHNRAYSAQELNQWVIPRLQQGKPIGQFEVFKLLWKTQHPIGRILFSITITMILMFISTKL